jgi:all-trans-retinol 13,14-reductase
MPGLIFLPRPELRRHGPLATHHARTFAVPRHIGVSYRQTKLADTWDAIVIGSGIGGLAAAALLAKRGGKRVLVLERHYTAGGFTHVFTRPGYEWDVGVHYIGQVGEGGALRNAFDEISDSRIEWARVPELYDRAILGDRSYDFVAGHAAFIEKMASYFPREGDAIAAYVEAVRACMRQARFFYLDKAVKPWASALLTPVLRGGMLKTAGSTTLQVLEKLTDNRELIGVLTAQYGNYGLPPGRSSFAAHAMTVAHYLGGAWYPVGGASAIARGIEPVITAKGGALVTSAEVDQVLVRDGRATGVKLVDGRELFAPLVISDAGLAVTYGRLLPGPKPVELASSNTYLCLYLGLDQSDRELGFTGTNLWAFPGPEHDQYCAAYEKDPEAPFPLVFTSFPSSKDPQWHHAGRATAEVIVPADFGWFEKWQDTKWMKRGADYDALKERFKQRMLEAFYARVPQAKGHVKHAELSTPLTTRHFAAHPRGELYGLSQTPERFKARLAARTTVKGFFLTGADVAMAGVSGALVGGVITASAILGTKLMTSVLTRKKKQ